MRKPTIGWLLLRTAALASALVAIAGCGGSDTDGSARPGVSVGAPAPQAIAASCAAADLSGLRSIVFVSSQGSDGAGCGSTTASACRTIQQGIASCSGTGCGVLVRHGLYPTEATLVLRDAVSVYGGCLFDGEPDRKYRSVIQAGPAPGTPALSAAAIGAATLIQGLAVIALGRDNPGDGANIAMTIRDSTGLKLDSVLLHSGRGAAGRPGASVPAAQPGGNGIGGTNAPLAAGAAGAQACPTNPAPGSDGDGGHGGDGLQGGTHFCFAGCACLYPNVERSAGGDGNPSGKVAGGHGGTRKYGGDYCYGPASYPQDFVGEDGQPGASGSCAGTGGTVSADATGRLDGAGWTPGTGGSGQPGQVGSGGGGGSSGGFCIENSYIPARLTQGVSAGAGGGGGCGGNGGPGGQQGGASIALQLHASTLVELSGNIALIPGPGGQGGDGGQGGTGGTGGIGGPSAPGRWRTVGGYQCPGPSGSGGNGGPGGAGSGGAGGNGGPSIGVALTGGAPQPVSSGIYPPLPGTGGAGGLGGQGGADNCSGATGANGIAGVAMPVLDYGSLLVNMPPAGQQPRAGAAASPSQQTAPLQAAASMGSSGRSASAQALAPSCPASLVPGGHDYHGLPLTMCNFSGLDLTNANFNGAKLKAVVFIRANLTGADFSGATILDSGNPVFTTDFSFANLTNAKFVGTTFSAPTYLTYATLGCTDFSNTVLNNGNAIFGDAPLALGSDSTCRTAFRGSTMNCEFVAQWDRLDLSGAIIDACVAQLQTVAGRAPYDFSNGIYSGVVFDGLDLSGSKWSGAVLEGASFQGATLDRATGLNGTPTVPSRLSAARFNKASVRNVDLSNAQLYGARFDDADLSNSSLAGSYLTANTGAKPPIKTAASFDGAHLRNVTLANAKLAGATFNYASFYGTFGGGTPAFPCKAANSRCSATGFTCGCATVSGADLTGTDFGNAYLYGVDFTGKTTTINGTKFVSAILAGASFENASFQVNGGAAPDFTKAMLQGTVFSDTANIGGSSLLDAFVDFGAATNPNKGNVLFLLLTADYTGFKGWNGAATPCVQAAYGVFTALPGNVSLICPNGNSAVCGAGTPAPNANPNWAGAIALANNAPVPGWYLADATYDKAPSNPAAVCNGAALDPNW